MQINVQKSWLNCIDGPDMKSPLPIRGGGHIVVSRGRKSVLTGGGKFYT